MAIKNQKIIIKHNQNFIADIETTLHDFILQKNVTPKSVILPNNDKILYIDYDSNFETYSVHFKHRPAVVLYKHFTNDGMVFFTDSLYVK